MNLFKMAMVVVASVFCLWACSSHDSSDSLLNPKAEDDVDVPDSLKTAYTQTITESDVARDLSAIAKALSVEIYPFKYSNTVTSVQSKLMLAKKIAENDCIPEFQVDQDFGEFKIQYNTRFYRDGEQISLCHEKGATYHTDYYWQIYKGYEGIDVIMNGKYINENGVTLYNSKQKIMSIKENTDGVVVEMKKDWQFNSRHEQTFPVEMVMQYGFSEIVVEDYSGKLSGKTDKTIINEVVMNYFFVNGKYKCMVEMTKIDTGDWSCELTHNYQIVGRIDSERGVRTVYDANGVLVK